MVQTPRFKAVLTPATMAALLAALALAAGGGQGARAASSVRTGESHTTTTSDAPPSTGGSEPTDVSSRGGGDTVPNPALVRTVSVPGGLSPEMRTALQSLEGLFSRSSESALSSVAPSGAHGLILGGGFLKVYVARLDEKGKIASACVSSLEEALRVMGAPDSVAAKGAVSSTPAAPAPEEE